MKIMHGWDIAQLECYPEHEGRANVVFTIHWRRKATAGAYFADVYGSQNITLDATAPFTPFDSLTKGQVESWLVNAMGSERVAELDANLVKQIEAQATPSVVIPQLPWA